MRPPLFKFFSTSRPQCVLWLTITVFVVIASNQLNAQTDNTTSQTASSISWQQPLIIVLTISSIMLSLFLAVYAWRRRQKSGVLTFAWLMTAITGSALVSGLSVFSRTVAAALFWIQWNFLGVAVFPVLFLIFILQYSGRERWLSRTRIVMLFIIPLITQVALWTNARHGLFFREVLFVREGALMLPQTIRPGPWFRIQMGYTYLLTLVSIICIVLMIIRPLHFYRKQAIGLFIGVIPPVLNSAIIVFDLIPGIKNQLTPFAFSLMGSVFAWTLFRHQFLDVVPVARDALIDSMGDGMLVLDNHNRIVDLNPAARHLFGQAASQFVGQPAYEVLKSWPGLTEYVHQGASVEADIELEHHEEHGYYHVKISIVSDKRERQTGKLLMLRDITKRKRAEAELLLAHSALQEKNIELHELNASKDKFFSIISHDLRGPFTTLLGMSQLLEENLETYTPDEITKRVHTLHVYTQRVFALLENLLTWSRLQRGGMQQQSELIQLCTIAEDNIMLYATNAEQKNITLTHTVSKNDLAYADYSMVNTVIHNLVSNALKFTPAGGKVIVSARDCDDGVEVSIADTGVGIPPGDFSKLFRIDQHYTHVGTDGEKGTGLGLILCQELVERNRGKIWVESEVGNGATFRFTLPVHR